MTWLHRLLDSAAPLLAQGQYVHMGRRFRQGSETGDPATFALFVCGLLSILAVALIAARMVAARNAPGFFSENSLFRELCRRHELDWTSRRVLRRLAVARQLNSPCQLFLDSSYFACEDLDSGLRSAGDQIQQLEQRLFAVEEEPAQ